MKTLFTPCLAMAALVGGAYSQKEASQDVPVVGLGSVAPIGAAARRLSSSATSGYESSTGAATEAELVQALQADKEVTVLGSVEVGELACDTLVVAEDASTLSFITHENESIVAERSSYTVTSGDAFTDGIIRNVWTGIVTDPPQADDESIPRTVSMTWGEVCDTETFLLKVTKRNMDGTTTILKTVPCDGSTTHTCLVEVLVKFDESSDVAVPDGVTQAAGTTYSFPSSDSGESSSTTNSTGGSGPGAADPVSSSSPSDRRLQESTDTVIDVMVLYSSTSLDTLGGISSRQMETIIAESIVESNQALVNSEVSAYFNPVHIGPLPYEVATSNDEYTLMELRYSDDVADLRDSTGADLVQLISDLDDSCGRGYFFNTDEAYGFSVVHATCIDNYSHTHEFGHNLGCSHNREDSDKDLEYAHGLRYCDGDDWYRTLESYSCGSPRVNYFSNPDVEYLNKPTGTAAENNARAIEDNKVAVSNFRVRSAASQAAYSYLGCFGDDIDNRVLSGSSVLGDPAMTVQVCAELCEGSPYFGLEYGEECFCGVSSDDPDELGDATCDYECTGDGSQTCGSWKTISVYEYTNFTPQPEYAGCWNDSERRRVMDVMLVDSSMTNELCAMICSAYPVYGTQNGEECWCGDASTDYTAYGESTECDVGCTGDAEALCGGNLAMTVWEH